MCKFILIVLLSAASGSYSYATMTDVTRNESMAEIPGELMQVYQEIMEDAEAVIGEYLEISENLDLRLDDPEYVIDYQAIINGDGVALYPELSRKFPRLFSATNNGSTSGNNNIIQFYTVGADKDKCDFTTIQEAIDGSGFVRVLRVASDKVYNENISIIGKNKILKGGYHTCTDAFLNNVSGPNSKIIGKPSWSLQPVINVENANSSLSFSLGLERFTITGGKNSGIKIAGKYNANFTDVLIYGNQGLSNTSSGTGGGIDVGEMSKLWLTDSVVTGNQALRGGGIHCDKGEVFILGSSSLSFNLAKSQHHSHLGEFNGKGGGIYGQSCYVGIHANQPKSGYLNLPGIISNQADKNAALFFKESIVDIMPLTNDNTQTPNPVPILMNKCNENCSTDTIFLDQSTLNAQRVNISYNKTQKITISLVKNSLLNLHCKDYGGICNTISDNYAMEIIDSLEPRVFHINPEAEALLADAEIKNHSINHLFWIEGDTRVVMENLLMINNGLPNNSLSSLIQITSDDPEVPLIIMKYLTIADNYAPIINIPNVPGGPVSMKIYSSILYDPTLSPIINSQLSGGVLNDSQIDCTLTATSIGTIGGLTVSRSIVANPNFKNSITGDYHLADDSPAIDYCDDEYVTNTYDQDNELRGYDLPGINKLHGLYDLGVDEKH